MADRLRFGAFVAPYHPVGQNPTLAMQRDLDLIAALDRLGYDEAWVGEHHSGGFEIIGSPEVFIGVASQRSPRIRLGTGVIGTSYHNPLWVAERMVLLDHLTRGRVMLGLGPGGLPTDGQMIGVSMSEVRDLHAEAVRCIVALLRGETVTSKTSMWTLNDARLQLRPYSDPCFDVAVSAVASPSGPRLAGEHGLAMLAIGATRPDGFAALASHWGLAEERAARFGQALDRRTWRLAGFFHVAETREQAERDVAHGIADWFHYFQRVASVPQVAVGDAATVPEMIATIRDSGLGVIGTVEDAVAQVEGLVAQTGGFGTYLAFAHEWADPAATLRSFELFAHHVMPRFQGHAAASEEAARLATAQRPRLYAEAAESHDLMVAKHEAEGAAG